jgi:hypothetical protein
MPPKVTPKTLDQSKRLIRGLELRAMSLTYQQIADTPWEDGPGGTMWGGDRHNCRRDIVAAYEQTIKEPADVVRTMEIERLDMMLAGLVDKGLFDGEAEIVRVGLLLMARRAKLIGLDAPTEINSRGGGNVQLIVDGATLREGMDAAQIEIDETAD